MTVSSESCALCLFPLLFFLTVMRFTFPKQVDDIERPLVSGDQGIIESEGSASIIGDFIGPSDCKTQADFGPPNYNSGEPKKRLASTSQLTHSNRC